MELRSLDNNPYSLVASNAVVVTPSDTTVLRSATLYIGTGGTLKVTTAGGQAVIFENVPSGSFLPVLVTKVWSTGTVGCADILLVY